MAEQGFSPKLFKFVLPKDFSDSAIIWSLKNYKAQVPSYSTLFSHTFAVVWHLFSKDGAELTCFDRADIAWALAFLEAIDTTSLGDVSFLDMVSNLASAKTSPEAYFPPPTQLVKYFRKILVSLYAHGDENMFSGVNQTVIEGLPPLSTSAACDDFFNSLVVQEDKKHAIQVTTVNASTCTDAEIIERLKQMNPNIKSLDDVLKFGAPANP